MGPDGISRLRGYRPARYGWPMFHYLDAGLTAVVGHRGAKAYAADNTVESFRLAAAAGADGVELDVRRTRDGVLMVHHDPTHPGVGEFIRSDWDDIRRVDSSIPTLEEAMDACTGMWVNVEIKNDPAEPDYDETDHIADTVVEWIETHGFAESVIISSFTPSTVNRCKQIAPHIATGQLCGIVISPTDAITMAADNGHDAIHPAAAWLAGDGVVRVVGAAEQAGVRVMTWTVNDPDEVRRLVREGIHGVISDDPGMVREIVGSRVD